MAHEMLRFKLLLLPLSGSLIAHLDLSEYKFSSENFFGKETLAAYRGDIPVLCVSSLS